MTLFVKSIKSETLALNKTKALEIYEVLRTGKSPNDIRIELGFSSNHITEVVTECKRLEGIVINHLSKTGGDTTKDDTLSLMDTEMLFKETVLDDIVRWSDGNPDKAPTWVQYKNSFKTID